MWINPNQPTVQQDNMMPDARGLSRAMTENFAVAISALMILSIGALVFAVVAGDTTSGVVGGVGLLVSATGFGVWGSNRWIRVAVGRLQAAGSVAWPVSAQTTEDHRFHQGFIEADDDGLAVTIRARTVRIGWSDIRSVMLEDSRPFRSGRIRIDGPEIGRVVFDVLTPTAMASVGDASLRECAQLLKEFKLRHG
jgi:hypothetical protein